MKMNYRSIAAIIGLGALLLTTVIPSKVITATRPTITVSSNIVIGSNGSRPIVK